MILKPREILLCVAIGVVGAIGLPVLAVWGLYALEDMPMTGAELDRQLGCDCFATSIGPKAIATHNLDTGRVTFDPIPEKSYRSLWECLEQAGWEAREGQIRSAASANVPFALQVRPHEKEGWVLLEG